jgi:hypothetical protein
MFNLSNTITFVKEHAIILAVVSVSNTKKLLNCVKCDVLEAGIGEIEKYQS